MKNLSLKLVPLIWLLALSKSTLASSDEPVTGEASKLQAQSQTQVKNKPDDVQGEKSYAGKFTQTKKIKVLKRPFKASGQFYFYQGKGVLWKTLLPIKELKVFSGTGVYKISEGGEKIRDARIDSELFFSLFSNDQEQLAKVFKVTQNENHCLKLKPIAQTLKEVIASIQLCIKDSQPQKINIIEANGNETKISLTPADLQFSQQELDYLE